MRGETDEYVEQLRRDLASKDLQISNANNEIKKLSRGILEKDGQLNQMRQEEATIPLKLWQEERRLLKVKLFLFLVISHPVPVGGEEPTGDKIFQ